LITTATGSRKLRSPGSTRALGIKRIERRHRAAPLDFNGWHGPHGLAVRTGSFTGLEEEACM
jgi:hypothetical protein